MHPVVVLRCGAVCFDKRQRDDESRLFGVSQWRVFGVGERGVLSGLVDLRGRKLRRIVRHVHERSTLYRMLEWIFGDDERAKLHGMVDVFGGHGAPLCRNRHDQRHVRDVRARNLLPRRNGAENVLCFGRLG